MASDRAGPATMSSESTVDIMAAVMAASMSVPTTAGRTVRATSGIARSPVGRLGKRSSATLLVNRVRLRKSAREIAYMQEAAATIPPSSPSSRRESIAGHGLEKASRLGYSCRLGYPPDWGEHTVSLRPGDESVLEPGITFRMIPGLWLDDFGVEISETFVVTESGSRTLTDLPRELALR